MLTMLPPLPCMSIMRVHWCASHTEAVRFTEIIWSISANRINGRTPSAATPALFTSTSMRPHRENTSRMKSLVAEGSAWFRLRHSAVSGGALATRASSSSLRDRLNVATLWPSRNRSTRASPRPRLPPLMTATGCAEEGGAGRAAVSEAEIAMGTCRDGWRSQLLEPGRVPVPVHDLDQHGDLVRLKALSAEGSDTGGEGLRILGRPAGRHPGDDDVARDGIRLADDQGLPDLVHLEQDALDLGRKDLLASDVDDVALPAQDLQVLTVDLDDILGVEPTLLVERRRRIEVADHRRLTPYPEDVV